MLSLKMSRDELLKAVARTSPIAEKRSSMPILSNILLEGDGEELKFTATDLEITFQGAFPAEIASPGRLTVPARKFLDIVRLLNTPEVALAEVDNFSLKLESGSFNTTMYGLSPEDFPPLPALNHIQYVDLDSADLVDAIDKTIFSVALEETRYNLAGVYLEKLAIAGQPGLRLVSTDGHRLNLAEVVSPALSALELDKGIIISKKGLVELRRMAEGQETVALGLTSSSAVAKGAGAVLVMRLLEGRFPDYNLVIPKTNDKSLLVGRRDFSDVLKRISTMSSDDYKAVKFSLKDNALTVSTVNPELGQAQETLEVDYQGPAIEVGFNPRYFLEVFGALHSERVTVAFQEEGASPCLITAAEDPGYIGVVMPMKI